MGVVYAICSLSFAGVNDVVFCRYGRKPRSVGLFLAGVGAVWMLFFLALGAFRQALQLDFVAIGVGSVAGALSIAANILLVESMKRGGASVAATIYRLNLVFVAIMAFLFLGEAMSGPRIAGIGMAVLAVILFSMPDEAGDLRRTAFKFLALLLLASFLRACMGISYKIASSACASGELFLAVNGAWWLLAGLGYHLTRERGMAVSKDVLKYSLLSGFLVCGIVFFLKLAVGRADAIVAVTVSQFSFLLTAPLSLMFMGERFSVRKLVGIALAASCIAIFSLSR